MNESIATLTNEEGLKWDAATISNIGLDIPKAELLEKLDLTVDGKLKRAGALCFYREPERVIGGCYVKIGKFEGSELLYQDEVHGSLLIMADRVIDLIYLKYLKAAVSYYKETRVEVYPFARDAVKRGGI